MAFLGMLKRGLGLLALLVFAGVLLAQVSAPPPRGGQAVAMPVPASPAQQRPQRSNKAAAPAKLAAPQNGTMIIDFDCPSRRPVRLGATRTDLPPPPTAPSALRDWARAANADLAVLNEDLFGSLADNPPERVIVVQVHRRERYVRWLLRSLSLVPGIERALLVLSHGHVDEALLQVAREVCFARVARVFFPGNLQMWGTEFPGEDCVNGTFVRGGQRCVREPRATVAKHHWWWLHNFVFTRVLDAARYKGVVLFLEEDMYLVPDALHALDKMRQAVPDADMYILNDNREQLTAGLNAQALQGHWVFNMGLALGERAWAKIVRCANKFCSHNDYNWDWTLQAVGAACVPGQFTTVVMKGARLFHVGKCGGMHFHEGADCDALVRRAMAVLVQMEPLLFPETLALTKTAARAYAGRANGGWADPRDHRLCLDRANASLARWGQAPAA